MEANKKTHNTVEKVTFILGIAVLVALVSFLIFQIFQQEEGPPNLEVTTTYEPFMEAYGFKVVVENKGQETAEGARIKFKLYQDGKEAEDATVDIRYVPVKSKETAWVVFHRKRKPDDSLVVSSVTYVKP